MRKYGWLIQLVLTLAVLGVALWVKARTPRVACVRSVVVVEGYLGMKEARALYEKKAEQWRANVDTLRFDLNRNIALFNQEYARLSEAQRRERKVVLQNQQASLENYQTAITGKAQEEEDKILQGAFNQINSFVATYAQEHNYDVVLGSTEAGNILYAGQAVDITDEILAGLNENYKTPNKK